MPKPGSGGTTTISGTNGDDTLSGLGGSYKLVGGNGNDTYIIDDSGDEVVERKNGGIDFVISHISYQLTDNVEHLTLAGTDDLWGYGNSLDNVITGNSGANELEGFAGNDRLDGGDGDDRLFGGDGDDTLIGGSGSDLLDGGAGDDLAVFAGLSTDYSFELSAGYFWVTRETSSGVETDRLTNVEWLQFDDGLFTADPLLATTPEPEPEPDPVPVAVEDDGTGLEDAAVTVAVLDNDLGQGLSVAAATNGAMGLVTVNDDGTVTYRPNAHAYGEDSFTYTITDSMGRTSSTTVTVTIAAENDAPVAFADSYSTVTGEVFVSSSCSCPSCCSSVLDNDSDVDGDPLTIASYDATSVNGGTVQMNADGTFSYTPAAGFVGTDSFSYTASDGNGGEATADVTMTVEAAPDPDAVPYYVEALLYGEDYKRLNYPDAVGTAVKVTYTFLQNVPDYYSSTSPIRETFRPFTEQQEQVARDVLALIENFSNLTFVEVASADEATVTFGLYDIGGDTPGVAVAPYGNSVANVYSDLWVDTEVAGDTFVVGTGAYKTLVHELGHAIGLDHPDLPIAEDNRQYTVMDYNSHPTMSGDVTGYQLYDIAALQYLYGANTGFATGQNIFTFSDLDGVIKTIWDGGGHDTFDMSAASYAVTLDLSGGAFSTVAGEGSNNIAIAFGTVIEDAIGGAYNDTLTGNEVANLLNGGRGDDRLTGGAGADIFDFDRTWGQDVVTDFACGEDLLDFRGSGATPDDLVIASDGTDTQIAYGDDLVTLLGIPEVTSSDFIWDIA